MMMMIMMRKNSLIFDEFLMDFFSSVYFASDRLGQIHTRERASVTLGPLFMQPSISLEGRAMEFLSDTTKFLASCLRFSISFLHSCCKLP
jgi:hypothetical protein